MILKQYDLPARCAILFSPVFGQLELRQLAEWILADKLSVRFQMQLHKYIWDPSMHGV
jgi:7-carboxy-7-deazaguanine synthase